MNARRPLTTRIVLAFGLFGSLLALLMAALVMGAFAFSERDQLNRLLSNELGYLRDSDEPHAALLDDLALYQGPAAEIRALLDAELADLRPGRHRVDHPARAVVVEESGGILRLVSVELDPMFTRESRLLLFLSLSVLGAVYVSIWAGFWLSHRIVEPVRSLSADVARRGAEASEPLASGYADDEVGALARAFDAYEGRIRNLLERERQFTDQASHELRTPVTVIAGAAELMLDDPALPSGARRRVQRIRRAALDMAELVETFLLLARDGSYSATATQSQASISQVARQVLDSQAVWAEGKPVTLRLDVEQDGPCPGPERLLAIVLANLIRNACQYTEHGSVEVLIRADGVEVADTGPGIPPAARDAVAPGSAGGPESERRGLGLPLVRSLCERQGWTLTLAARPAGGTRAALHFAPRLHAPFTSA